MGYCINLVDVDLWIPAKHLDEAYRRMQDLNNPENNHLKNGGSSGPGQERTYWFSWMNGRYSNNECVDAADILDELRFDVKRSFTTGSLLVLGFDGEKIGQENLFFDAIADLIPAGCFMEWLGEDGERWRWTFDGTSRTTQYAQTVWEY